MSFARLVNRLKEGLAAQPQAQPNRHDPLRLATAAVLLEIGHADGTFDPSGDGNLAGYLEKAFHLSTDEAKDLIGSADDLRGQTIDHFALTHYIRRNMTLQERIEIVKTMWRIVYSDGKLSDYENYLVRKLADLLGLEHHVMIDAKVAVLRERGSEAK